MLQNLPNPTFHLPLFYYIVTATSHIFQALLVGNCFHKYVTQQDVQETIHCPFLLFEAQEFKVHVQTYWHNLFLSPLRGLYEVY